MNQKRQSGVAEGSEFAGFCLESAIGRVSESGLWAKRSCLCVTFLATWFTDLQGATQIRSVADPVSLSPEQWWQAPTAQGQIGPVSSDLVPQ